MVAQPHQHSAVGEDLPTMTPTFTNIMQDAGRKEYTNRAMGDMGGQTNFAWHWPHCRYYGFHRDVPTPPNYRHYGYCGINGVMDHFVNMDITEMPPLSYYGYWFIKEIAEIPYGGFITDMVP